MKFKIIAALLLCGGLGAPAWAAQQCPLGIPSEGNPLCIPPDRSNSPYYQGGSGSTPRPPPALWANRWGAIARDRKTGEWGSAENEQSKARAEQVAMADCRARTTDGCEVIHTYRNQCTAFASGTSSSGVAGSPTVADAITRAIASCSTGGKSGCQAIYSACSMPVRIQ
jgi:hypothetical protein